MVDEAGHSTPLLMRSLLACSAMLLLIGCASLGRPQAARAADGTHGDQASLADSNLRLARAARAARDYASAVNLYRVAATATPSDTTVDVELGDTLVDAGSYDDAIYVYNKVDKTSPVRTRSLLGLMRVELILNEPAKALAYADAAKEIAPQDVKVLIGRGVTLDTVGRHAEAQQSYRVVVAADPHNIAARNDLALSLALTGSFDEAIEIMEPIALSSNAAPRSRQNLSLIYALKGDTTRAASMSRLDLDDRATASNLHLIDIVRSGKN